MAITLLSDLRARLRDRLGLSKFSELSLTTIVNDAGSANFPMSADDDKLDVTENLRWDQPDVVEAIIERARLLYTGYRGGATQVDAALGQFFDKEAKQHDSAPHVFDR